MKNILASFSIILLLITHAVSSVSGQEPGKEKKIKIVVDDGSGKKILLDTLITGDISDNKIVLKDGKTVVINDERDGDTDGEHGMRTYTITSSDTDQDDSGEVTRKEVTIITSDGEEGSDDFTWIAKSPDCGKHISSEKDIHYIGTGEEKSGSERTRYVINHNDIKITIEGSDYDKVREVLKEIEKSLGKE